MKTKFGNASINTTTGHYIISSHKEGNRSKNLHRLIFEDFYGPIPKNCVVHHKDGNKLNNCIMNLELMTWSDHAKHHFKENEHPRKGYRKPNSISKAGYRDWETDRKSVV